MLTLTVRGGRPRCGTTSRVLGSVYQFQVMDIDALAYTTQMVNRKSTGDGTMLALPGVPMRIAAAAVIAELSVAVTIVGTKIN